MSVAIHPSPACGTSRSTRNGRMGMAPRQILRRKGGPCAERGLDDPALGSDQGIDAIVDRPVLVDRRAVDPHGVELCRPSEEALSILDRPLTSDVVTKDGEVVAVDG